MSIQIGSSTLKTYGNYKEQLFLTTTSSNLPVIKIDTTHPLSNVYVQTGDWSQGQSNNYYIVGRNSNYTSNINGITRSIDTLDTAFRIDYTTGKVQFIGDIEAPSVTASLRNANISSTVSVPNTVTSNLIVYNTTRPYLTVKNDASNLFVVNGNSATSYFNTPTGFGVQNPTAPLHATNILVNNTISSTIINTDILQLQDLGSKTFLTYEAGTAKFDHTCSFTSNLIVQGVLIAANFIQESLVVTNASFRSNVYMSASLNINENSNQMPALSVTKPYFTTTRFDNSSQQPLLRIDYSLSNDLIVKPKVPVLVADSVGKIGIGTYYPQRLVDIYSQNLSTAYSNIGFLGIQGYQSNQVFVIDSNACIGIGTTLPTAFLDMYIHQDTESITNNAYINISSNTLTETLPILRMDHQGNVAIRSAFPREDTPLLVDGTTKTTKLIVANISGEDMFENSTINFTNCNIDGVQSLEAFRIICPELYTSNVIADYVTASNYNLLAFNSYLASKEFQIELDDFIFSGRQLILNRNYTPYFEQIGGTNSMEGLEGTTDPNLENKPTDKLNTAVTGKLYVIPNETFFVNSDLNTNPNNSTNGITISTSNIITNTDIEAMAYMHVEGNRGAGYSMCSTVKTPTNPLVRWTTELNAFSTVSNDFDTTLVSMKRGAEKRRIAWQYTYSADTIRLPKLTLTTAGVSKDADSGEKNVIETIGTCLYARGNFRFDDSTGVYPVLHSSFANNLGTISINTTTPDTKYQLYVNGSTYTERNSFIKGTLNVTSNIYANSVVSQLSDKRIKTGIQLIEKPLEKIQKLNGYTYQRTDTHAYETGLVAQEVNEVIPELVSTNTEGLYTIAYGNMAGLFVEGMKAMQKRIEELEKQVALLSSLIK